MVKQLVRRYVGEHAWRKLTEFRIEMRLRNISNHMDPLIAKELMPLLGEHGLYVEVGAHDGRSSSNTLILKKEGGEEF